MTTERHTKTILNVIKILIAVLLAGYILSKTDINTLLALHEKIVLPYLVGTFIIYASLTLLKAFRYQSMIPQRTDYPRVLNIVVMQNAISNFFANSAGIASYLALFRVEEKVKLGRSSLVLIITKLGDLFAVWAVMLICSILLWDQTIRLHGVLVLAESIIGLGFIAFFAALFLRKPFISFFNSVLARLHLTKYAMFNQAAQIMEAFADMEQGSILRIVAIAFGLSILNFLLILVWMVLSLRVFGFQAQAWVILFVSGILQLLSFFPVSIFGGLGVTEVTSLYFYSLFGIDQAQLSAVLVGWRILFYLTNLFVLLYLPVYTVFIERKLGSNTG
jgi:uncharacterized membrane protein YbhN (UPF0104 family)